MSTYQHATSPAGDGLHDSDSTFGGLALLLRPDEEWREQALCSQIGGEDWFPEKGGSNRPAKAICNGRGEHAPCPVREDCLRFALDHDERFGIWGGLSERERRRLRPSRPVVSVTAAAPVRARRPVGIDHGTEAGFKAHKRLGEPMCAACDVAGTPAPTPPPAPERRDRPGVTRPWTPAELADAVRLLADYGMTVADIAAELHVPARRVREHLPARRVAA